MSQVNVTLSLVKEFFRSNPAWTTWEQMQINKIEFHVRNLSNQSLSRINVPLPAVSSPVITANVPLPQNTNFAVRAVAFSPNHPNGVQSTEVNFNTNDTATFFNFQVTILDDFNMQPVTGAVLTFDPLGLNILRTADDSGMVWIQRIPAGTYPIRVTAPGFITLDITWTAGTAIGPNLILSQNVQLPSP